MLSKRLSFLSLIVALFLFIAKGAGEAAEKAGWQAEWEKTLKTAEAEGEVTVYVVDYPRFTVALFQKTYPKIRLNLVDGPSGPALSSRLMAERRAGKHLADLYIGGQGTHVSVLYPAKALAPMPPAFILPEVKDESKWFKGKHRFVDPETRHSFVFQGHRGIYISTNSQQMKAEQINSWWDLLNPKWKGKIIGYDPTIAGVARNVLWYLYMNQSLGPEFMSKLYGDMKLTLSRDHRQLVDWLVAGKAAVCVPCDDAELGTAQEQGLPVESVFHTLKEGDYIAAGQGVVSLITPSPHPYAAQVFLNWFLSREGQSLYQEHSVKSGQRNANSRRTDIPKDVIAPQYRLKEDAVFWENGPTVAQETAEATKLLKGILAKRP
ncbi:MAG TPA: extracellular solute-binding protein [Candidatus Binatia bacterium]|nr:extracellular solute-binding protein [Candidatus Binatia bacterium]